MAKGDFKNIERARELGAKGGRNKKGARYETKKTKLLKYWKQISDAEEDLLKVWKKLLNSTDKDDQKLAAKEISKYVFAQKREHTGEVNQNLTVNFKY